MKREHLRVGDIIRFNGSNHPSTIHQGDVLRWQKGEWSIVTRDSDHPEDGERGWELISRALAQALVFETIRGVGYATLREEIDSAQLRLTAATGLPVGVLVSRGSVAIDLKQQWAERLNEAAAHAESYDFQPCRFVGGLEEMSAINARLRDAAIARGTSVLKLRRDWPLIDGRPAKLEAVGETGTVHFYFVKGDSK